MVSGSEAAKALQTYLAGARNEGVRSAAGQGNAPASGPEQDQLSLSTKQAVAHWVAQVKSLPEVRAERVQRLQSRVDAGQYRPDGRSIAREILARIASDRLGRLP